MVGAKWCEHNPTPVPYQPLQLNRAWMANGAARLFVTKSTAKAHLNSFRYCFKSIKSRPCPLRFSLAPASKASVCTEQRVGDNLICIPCMSRRVLFCFVGKVERRLSILRWCHDFIKLHKRLAWRRDCLFPPSLDSWYSKTLASVIWCQVKS